MIVLLVITIIIHNCFLITIIPIEIFKYLFNARYDAHTDTKIKILILKININAWSKKNNILNCIHYNQNFYFNQLTN